MNKKDNKTSTPMNEKINLPEVRCLGDDGTQYGIVSSKEALKIAQTEGLDLVLIAPDAKPPVVKIMDFGKFKYQQEKKAKEAKKKQVKVVVKEIKLTAKIAQNDINFKIKHALEFLAQGNHVKFRVFLRGREVSNPESGKEVLLKVKEMLGDAGIVEKEPQFEGRFVNMYVLPPKHEKKKSE
ncbi:MAG: translation initiation factor [Campylobacterota bacterium]|nr:translation initiation factor [Campylobacterota bacterium]